MHIFFFLTAKIGELLIYFFFTLWSIVLIMQDDRPSEENTNIRTYKESLIQNCYHIQTCGGHGATSKKYQRWKLSL